MTMRNKIVILSISAVILFTVALVIVNNYQQQRQSNRYLAAIDLAGTWFLNNQNETFLYYEYDPVRDRYGVDGQPLREMGAMWSIAAIGVFADDARWQELARRGFDHFSQYFKSDSDGDYLYVNVEPGRSKIGYSAFAILALLDIDHPQKDYYLNKLAEGLLSRQQEDGSLATFFEEGQSGGEDYYPGESLTALMALYQYNHDPRYLEAVGKALPYYSDYWEDNNNTAFVPWQSRAYYGYFQETGSPEAAEFVYDMNDFMLDQHNPAEDCRNFDFSRGSVTGVYVEGVNMAYALARDQDEADRQECYQTFALEGLEKILALQIPPTEEYPVAAWGGIRATDQSALLRVDRNQHALLALIDAYELGITD